MHSFATCLSVAALAAVPLLAQQPSLNGHTGPRQDVARHAFGVHADADAVQAMGPHYKAAFTPGLCFTPAFGDRAEHNQELSLQLVDVRRGEHVVFAADAVTTPTPRADGNRVELAHSATLRERFDVREDGIEQSFVFATRPAGSGDLRVHSRITTPLTPRQRDDGTLCFELPGIGGVTIGGVTGIDQRGERTGGELHLVGDMLELSLPAAFVDRASYPLVLDPLIGTQFQLGVNDDGESDVGYERGYGHYLVTWVRRYSAFDHDIYGQFVTQAGVPTLTPIWIDSAVDICDRPRVGTVALHQRYLVAYQRADSPFGQADVVCRIVDPNGFVTARTTIAGTSAGEWNPSVSSEITTNDDEVLVAYEVAAGVDVVQVTIPATGTAVLGVATSLSTSILADNPSISRTGGVLGFSMVVWSQRTAADRELVAAVVDRDGTLLTSTIVPFTNNSLDDDHPVVDGDGSTYVVAYEQSEAGNPALRDIMAARLQFTGTSIARLALDLPIENDQGQDEYAPDIGWLGPKYGIVFEEYVAGLNTDIGGWLVNDNCTHCNSKLVLSGLNPTANRNHEHKPRIGPRWAIALNGVDDDGLLSFTESDDVPPFAGSVICQRIQALGVGLQSTQIAPGCGNGGTAAFGPTPFVIGNANFQFSVSGLEANAAPFLSLGFPGPGILCGACSLTTPVGFDFHLNVGGAASGTIAVPCDPSFTGLPIELQWVSFLTTQSPCPLAAGVSASQRVQITIGN